MSKILITTSSFNIDIAEIAALSDMGYEIVLNPYKRKLSEDEIYSLMDSDIIGIIAGVEPLTQSVMNKAPNLRVISRCGIGMDSVDIVAAQKNGIIVSNTPDAPTKAVAELTIGLMLDALRSISHQDRAIRNGQWNRHMGSLLGEKTIGLIGFGRIGKRVAEYAEAFGSKTLAYDPLAGQNASIDEVLSQSDIVSLHIPYSLENKHIINAETLSKMKGGSILINASRGGLIDEDALYSVLQTGKLAAAALDVYENEPYQGKLTELENITLTAHVGSYAREARAEQERLAAQNLLEALQETQNSEVCVNGS